LFVLFAPALLAGCAGDVTQEFTSPEGKFTVAFPGTPQEDDDPSLSGEGIHKVSLMERSGFYAVAYQFVNLPDHATASDLEERLEQACTGAVRNLKARLLSKKKITLAGKYPGRDLVAEWGNKQGIVHYHLYLVDGRLYQVIVSGEKWWVESPKAQKFLDSFRLSEE
jgi:hypothetical protein